MKTLTKISILVLLLLFNYNLLSQVPINRLVAYSSLADNNYSLSFQGNGYVQLANQLVNNPNEFTIEVWVKPSQQSTENGMVFYHGQGGEIDFVVGNNFTVYFDVKMTDGTFHGVSSINKLTQNQWAHIAGVYKRSEQKLKIFINGTLDVTFSIPNLDLYSPSGLVSRLGNYGGAFVRNYIGLIDEVRFSNVARYSSNFFPSTDLQSDANTVGLWKFNEGTGSIAYDGSGHGYNGSIVRAQWSSDFPIFPPDGLVAYYPFNGNANDESGHSNNLTVTNAVLVADRFGYANKAYSFNGTNAYLSLSSFSGINSGNSVHTISGWIYYSQLPTYLRSWPMLFGNSGTNTSEHWILTNSSVYHIGFFDITGFSISATTGVWTHICVSYDGASIKGYINGQLVQSVATSNWNLSGVPLTFAKVIGTDPAEHYFQGRLDDFRFYNCSLTDAGIQALYHEGGWQQYTITTLSNPSIGGSTTGAGTYNSGQNITVTATPNIGYSFANWTDGGNVVSTSRTYSFSINSDKNLVANFILLQYTINTTINPSGSGTVTGGGVYNYGTNISLIAKPNDGFVFVNWSEGSTILSSNLNYDFTVTGNRNLAANFATKPTLTVYPEYIGFSSSAGSGSFSVVNTTGGTMSWTAVSNANWITITNGGSGINSGYINFSIQSNSGASRVGTITITSVNAVNSPKNVEVRQDKLVSVEEETLPTRFALLQNFPNPFNPSTTIKYQVPTQAYVVIKLFSSLGQEIRTLVNEEKTQGRYELLIDGSELVSGVYFCQMRTQNFVETKKLVLTR